MKKHDKLGNFIIATVWWIVVCISSILLMKCAMVVGGAANIIAGIIILAGTAVDALLGIISIIAYYYGKKDVMEEIWDSRANVFDEFVEIGVEAGQESATNQRIKHGDRP